MVIIGAIIGGITNSLAIKMLFRPYEPKYIGKWRVPLTPGLIPKRRQELAQQLGKMVVEHLLTPEGLKRKFGQAEFQQQLTVWAQSEVTRLLETETTAQEALAKIGVYLNEPQLREKISNWTEAQFQQFLKERRATPVKELISADWLANADQQIDRAATYVQQQLVTYVDSEDAKVKIGEMIDSYLEGKGFLGNMISSFMGNEGLSEQIHPIIVDYVRSTDTKQMIAQLLQNEFEKIINQPLGTIEEKFDAQSIGKALGKLASNSLPLEKWLTSTVKQWTTPIKEQLLSHILPTLITKTLAVLEQRLDVIMEKFGLEEVVEKQVESFPVERVEQLILAISKKEFKLITYLGALLGGAIGLIQGLIVVVIG